jgi:hypothetical protein
VAQSEHVELADGPGLVLEVLDFNGEGHLVGIEFRDQGNVPPGASAR